jgi:hypothetical protein
MAILRLSTHLCEPFTIFRPTIFKFWILLEDYIKIIHWKSLDTITEPMAGPSGLGGEEIDNLSRDVKKLHVHGKRPAGAEKRRRHKDRAPKEGTLTLEKSDNETCAGESLVAKR